MGRAAHLRRRRVCLSSVYYTLIALHTELLTPVECILWYGTQIIHGVLYYTTTDTTRRVLPRECVLCLHPPCCQFITTTWRVLAATKPKATLKKNTEGIRYLMVTYTSVTEVTLE